MFEMGYKNKLYPVLTTKGTWRTLNFYADYEYCFLKGVQKIQSLHIAVIMNCHKINTRLSGRIEENY